jgi:hypothetical protein
LIGPRRSTRPPARTELRWETLPADVISVLRTVAIPLSAGYSKTQVANSLGIAPSHVRLLVDWLENELAQPDPP